MEPLKLIVIPFIILSFISILFKYNYTLPEKDIFSIETFSLLLYLIPVILTLITSYTSSYVFNIGSNDPEPEDKVSQSPYPSWAFVVLLIISGLIAAGFSTSFDEAKTLGEKLGIGSFLFGGVLSIFLTIITSIFKLSGNTDLMKFTIIPTIILAVYTITTGLIFKDMNINNNSITLLPIPQISENELLRLLYQLIILEFPRFLGGTSLIGVYMNLT